MDQCAALNHAGRGQRDPVPPCRFLPRWVSVTRHAHFGAARSCSLRARTFHDCAMLDTHEISCPSGRGRFTSLCAFSIADFIRMLRHRLIFTCRDGIHADSSNLEPNPARSRQPRRQRCLHGFAVSSRARSGRRMGEHCLDEARRLCFRRSIQLRLLHQRAGSAPLAAAWLQHCRHFDRSISPRSTRIRGCLRYVPVSRRRLTQVVQFTPPLARGPGSAAVFLRLTGSCG